MNVQVAASILSADFAALGDAVRAAERGGAEVERERFAHSPPFWT